MSQSRWEIFHVSQIISLSVYYFHVCSISPEPFEWLSSNFPQIILSKMVCGLPLIQLPNFKVTVLGQRIYPWILFLLHISWTFRIILIRLHSNIPSLRWFAEIMTWQIDSRSRSYFKVLGFTLQFGVGSLYPLWMIFIKLHSNVLLSAWISYPYWRSHFKVKRFCWRSFSYLLDCCLDN